MNTTNLSAATDHASVTSSRDNRSEPQCVEIVIVLADPESARHDLNVWLDLRDTLETMLPQSGHGELGDCIWSTDESAIFCIGRDAELIWNTIKPLLDPLPFPPGSHAIKRFGGPGGGREERINLPS